MLRRHHEHLFEVVPALQHRRRQGVVVVLVVLGGEVIQQIEVLLVADLVEVPPYVLFVLRN